MAAEMKFGTEGWRGIIAWDFTFDRVRLMAQALADYINENAPSDEAGKMPQVFVGYDRRFLSDRFATEIAVILRSNKIDAVLASCPVSSPIASFLSDSKFWMSIMITASHNPAHYNGIKIKIAGVPVSLRTTREIEALIGKSSVLSLYGQKPTVKDFTETYFKKLATYINKKDLAAFKGKVVVDYMHGATSGYAEKFISDKQLVSLHTEHDPFFGGIQPDPSEKNLAELKKAVTANKAALGIAFDGDGDRVSLLDEKGKYISPCLLAAVLCDYLIASKKIKGKIVQTVSMGYLLKRIAANYNFPFEEVGIGFKNIAEIMLLEDVAFGVEEAGGYTWGNSSKDRDGLLTALTFMSIMGKTGKKASELCAEITKKYGASAYSRKDIPLSKPVDKEVFVEKLRKKLPKKINNSKVVEFSTVDGLKVYLDKDEWVLFRPSGTENLMRVYAECVDEKRTETLLEAAEKIVAPFLK